ncbi:MAG: Mov34/MPN/PAD-1 family protein [Methanomassiliicoccales archaeon]|nr:Mov34/MPN/PAD-1 family protein [Methanomassiliicoccales archaeon]
MHKTPVVLEQYAFSSLLMSAIEIHGRESMGLLIGHKDRQFVQGKVVECLAIQASYPIQSAERGRSMVGYGNFAARKRLNSTVNAVGFVIVGGFHSHPNSGTALSKADKEFIFDEFNEVYSKTELDAWLEVIIGVTKIKRPEKSKFLKKHYKKKNPNPGFYPWNVTPEIIGDLLTDTGAVFRVELKGYWFNDHNVEEALLVYSRY